MNFIRLFFSVILGMMLLTGRGWAQEDNVMKATSALQDVLSNLQQSVTKLAIDNDQLASRDSSIKDQLQGLQAQLGSLQAQGDRLKEKANQLQAVNPRRESQIERLEEVSIDLNHRVQKAQEGIKFTQESLNNDYQEDQKLLLRLKGMQSTHFQGDAHLQKEKLRLMKMIYESEQRQEALHAFILGYQQDKPLLPIAGALAQQQLLKEQIKDLEAQLAPAQDKHLAAAVNTYQWDDTELRQLELELKVLEKNYDQFKVLMTEMTKKAQNTKLTGDEKAEESKIQGNIESINRQSIALRADLDDLCAQMVELDKRKSRLERMIQY